MVGARIPRTSTVLNGMSSSMSLLRAPRDCAPGAELMIHRAEVAAGSSAKLPPPPPLRPSSIVRVS
jgi:hypothetical protein